MTDDKESNLGNINAPSIDINKLSKAFSKLNSVTGKIQRNFGSISVAAELDKIDDNLGNVMTDEEIKDIQEGLERIRYKHRAFLSKDVDFDGIYLKDHPDWDGDEKKRARYILEGKYITSFRHDINKRTGKKEGTIDWTEK